MPNADNNSNANGTPPNIPSHNSTELSREEIDIWNTLSKEIYAPTPTPLSNINATSLPSKSDGIHPLVAIGLTGALIAHGAIMFSLPPVIRGKGAPFLPTASKGLNVMFQELKRHPTVSASLKKNTKLNFVDLGSGDGRVVFRAAREGLFHKSVGYEINPVLHFWANMRRTVQAPKYWSTTDFHMQDLWKVDLSNADVIAVYGLHPIMKRLGKKMESELKPGSIVVSNVFTIPGWKPIKGSQDRVHFYSVPESFMHENDKGKNDSASSLS